MYYSVENLLNDEKQNPVIYSFDNETENKNYLDVKNSIERYFIYKSQNIKNNNIYEGSKAYRDKNKTMSKSITDCDKCELSQDIYKKLWSKAIEYSEKSMINGTLGDTLTSVQHTLNMAFEIVLRNDETFKPYIKGKNSLALQIELLYFEHDKILSKISQISGLETFINRYHTIGNFMPVPEGFNENRSNFGKDDYIDVMLIKIKQWYDTKDINVLQELLHKNNKTTAVDNCEKWLIYFKSWENFVKENYLEAFVDNKLNPIELKPRSSNEKELKTFFDTCSKLIEKRGKRMVDSIKK